MIILISHREPLYAIMEFMLYGDLKTYLLARRDLVNENRISDDSDISPKKLTLMALDVARGLSYLASLKYVHRDIACRNCMINAQRIVKIGDFGMARNTFDKEYYPFGRNSMLPIRWMAVETFNDGKFSHASDMWSYAVLLFEIITLGGFPFQGLSNHQVLATVRTGGHINIPDGCKPQLQAIMKSCFNHDPTKRPTASTIVEFISNYPRMLTPCMDVPKPNINDQVNLIDDKQETDIDMMEFEEQISDRGRSHTPINKFDILKTSCSTSALQTSHQQSSNMHENDDNGFEYLPMNMNINRRPNDMFLKDFNPDLTSALPNRIYNPIEPLLTQRQEISKSNNSLMRYMPMSKGKNRNLHLEECTSKI
jgi:serine/threonine protein kinase